MAAGGADKSNSVPQRTFSFAYNALLMGTEARMVAALGVIVLRLKPRLDYEL